MYFKNVWQHKKKFYRKYLQAFEILIRIDLEIFLN